MKKELQDRLFQTYSILFERRLLPMKETCLCFGIETNDGWFPLLAKMCHELEQLRLTTNPEVRFEQIKEKFGSLRVYLESGNKDAYNIVSKYEKLSAITCEISGETGKLYIRNGWLKTLCEEEAENWGAELVEEDTFDD